MQYIRYENCTDEEGVKRELDSLVQRGLLTPVQREMVNATQISGFFHTEIGRKLRSGTPYLREFKFSILDRGSSYGNGLEEEQVLLQGVVDCALLEPDGITILDFKTDRVSEETLEEVTMHYRLQVQTYAEAMSRIYEMPVKASYLYFFRMNRFVKV